MKYTSSLKLKLIYIFRINDSAHEGCLKIGEATAGDEDIWGLAPNSSALNKAAKTRINSYTQTAGISYDLLYTEVSIYMDGGTINAFNDKEVHNVLKRSGVKQKIFDTTAKANEWYITDLETAKKAIVAVKDGRSSLNSNEVSNDQNPIIFRPEQKEAIDKTKKQFKKGNIMLWFAKMRFGKTLSALQVVKELQFKRTLILTHRPVVDAGWFEDFGKIFYDQASYQYGSKNQGEVFSKLEQLAQENLTNYIYFASMQDLRGSELVGGNFDKNNEIFDAIWDFIIVDEAHEGTQTELGKNVIFELQKEDTKVLHLSGTPFNLLDNYKEDEIYTWDYVMEQRAKKQWDQTHFGDPNPYSSLPRLNIYTYDLGKLLKSYVDEELAFNFREFFRVNNEGHFIHHSDVEGFLDLICKKDKESNYPFSTDEYRDNFRHTLWMVPGVKEGKALSSLMQKHSVFSQFEIVNVAGDGDDDAENAEALKKVNSAIGKNPHETYTITLSCGRLTTGVSVKPWTAVFMLAGSYNTSASGYMQTIFRVQTPATINGRVKEECFVFDFAPDRTLKVIAETAKVSAKAGKTTASDREQMGEFLNFCPIISSDGSKMATYDVNSMLEQLKKVYVERVVRNGFEDNHLYNDNELMTLGEEDLKDFNDLKEIIGSTKAMPKAKDIEVNKQGFTDEEYEKIKIAEKKRANQLSEEEKELLERKKEKKKQKDSAISILRGISIRMPLMIYGADVNNEDIELSIDNFATMVDQQSWLEFMPNGVTKQKFNAFKKYYDPDVFRAAGKRIRAIARAADQLPVEERLERITHIFGTFRNPDKETVLTPWKVVNRHMGDCIGGYVFYDENFEKQLAVPRFVSQGKVTEEIFANDTKILEINSKSGLYPLFMAYSMYRNSIKNSLLDGSFDDLTVEQQNHYWDTVVVKNIFVICKTPMAKAITQRTLCGFRNTKINAHAFDDLVNQIKNNADKFIEKARRGRTYNKEIVDNNMKFNAIVGNPPYQEMDGGAGASAKPVYNNFVEIAKNLTPKYISMITPSRWFAGGKGLDDFRDRNLNDKCLSKIFDYVNAKDCFPNTSIGGGINYFLWDLSNNAECLFTSNFNGKISVSKRKLNQYLTLIRFNEAIPILAKVNKDNNENISSLLSSRNPFGFPTKERGLNVKKERSITLYSSDGKSYIDLNPQIEDNPYLNSYKVMISRLTSEHAGEPDKDGKFKVLSRIELLKPKEVCTDSYLIVGNFDNPYESKSLFLYLKTKFFRFLLAQAVTSINLSRDKFNFVPLQNFTENSDIDWSKSIPEIDKQLYTKYKFNAEDITFIEGMIKPME